MSRKDDIRSVTPKYAIPDSEICIEGTGFPSGADASREIIVGGLPCTVTAISPSRALALVPDGVGGTSEVEMTSDDETIGGGSVEVGTLLADEMHIVANPAVDPEDGAVIVTRSGSRGQRLPNTIYRIETSGYIDEMPEPVMNPTGIAFGPDGRMYVSNRAEGEVVIVGPSGIYPIFATGLGVATGLAFDGDGVLFVGDRTGTIYRVPGFGRVQEFATLEASVAAYHLAFGPDGRLYVSAPGLTSHDSIYAIDTAGGVERFVTGFGRPQGLAFDSKGDLYVAACHEGRRGIFRISDDGSRIEHFVAASNAIGLCFAPEGKMIVATNSSVYSLETGLSPLN